MPGGPHGDREHLAGQHERGDVRPEQGQPAGAQLPLLLDQGGGDADDEQVMGVGEQVHAGDQDREGETG
jgi:hypothetical protein